jgi:hypothetical protein
MVSEGGDSMVHISRWVIWAILLVSLGIIWYANILGLWYVTFLVGIALTGLPVRGGVAAFLSASVSAAGWGLPLAWMSRTGHMHAAAAAVSAMMGFGTKLWWVVDAITVLTGLLLGLAGTWLGRAVLALVRPSRTVHEQNLGVADSPDDYIASGDEW